MVFYVLSSLCSTKYKEFMCSTCYNFLELSVSRHSKQINTNKLVFDFVRYGDPFDSFLPIKCPHVFISLCCLIRLPRKDVLFLLTICLKGVCVLIMSLVFYKNNDVSTMISISNEYRVFNSNETDATGCT